jgi:spoIIIJ-associated protein
MEEGELITARTVEEAVEEAEQQFGIGREELEIEVLNEGKLGILGFGAVDARIRVRQLSSPERQERLLKRHSQEVLQQLLKLLNLRGRVEIVSDEAPTEGGVPQCTLDVVGDDLGILIGRRGETLATLQYVVNLILSRQMKTRVAVTVDVEGYRRRRRELLEGMALRMADHAKTTGQTVTLEPMPPNERRLVHLALAGREDVETHSSGEGDHRKVVIVPKGNTFRG